MKMEYDKALSDEQPNPWLPMPVRFLSRKLCCGVCCGFAVGLLWGQHRSQLVVEGVVEGVGVVLERYWSGTTGT